jgi:hypothetical protein
VLRHNIVWRAKRRMSVRCLRARHCVAACEHDVAARGNRAVWRDEGASMRSPLKRHPSEQKEKPVRQCARRGMLDLDVAQASPLFSDHAPREVHLWQ